MKYTFFLFGYLVWLFLPASALWGHPIPHLNQPLVPTSARPGDPAFTLTVNGTKFVVGATVFWNGSPRPTSVVNSSKLTAAISAADIERPGTAIITAANPGNAPSNPIVFPVAEQSSSVLLRQMDFPATVSPGAQPNAVAVGDFNGDGKLDLAITNFRSHSVSILMGNGDGTFASPVGYDVAAYPRALTAADLNRDGKPDLAVTTDNTISVLLGNGDGSFQPFRTNVTGKVSNASPVAADFRGIGVLDLAIASSNDLVGTISILLGYGSGNFQKHQDYPVTAGAFSLTTGDFNHDGKLDLAVSDTDGSTLSIFQGNSDGTFQFKMDYPVGQGPVDVIAADFNRDGLLDLAVDNQGSNTISVLFGNRDGTFRAGPTVASSPGQYPYPLITDDFNDDGFLDLVTVGTVQSAASIIVGNGDGTFFFRSGEPTGHISYRVAAGDFNGDGRLDLAVTNPHDDTVSIFLQIDGPARMSGARF